MDIEKRITFVTTTMGTRWESYSQACLAAAFPHSTRILVNGRRDWHPLRFLDFVDDVETDYLVHVDEDCFLLEREYLQSIIRHLDESEQHIVAGTPDGGTFHRDHNPYACNLFFLVMKWRAVKQVLAAHQDWRETRWDTRFARSGHERLDQLDGIRIQYDDFENYYSFFWTIFNSDYRIHYLIPTLDSYGLFASELRVADAEVPAVLHMWWLRKWADPAIEPYLGVSHASRFERLDALLTTGALESKAVNSHLRKQKLNRWLRNVRWRLFNGRRAVC